VRVRGLRLVRPSVLQQAIGALAWTASALSLITRLSRPAASEVAQLTNARYLDEPDPRRLGRRLSEHRFRLESNEPQRPCQNRTPEKLAAVALVGALFMSPLP
jgi:hypothetical protein